MSNILRIADRQPNVLVHVATNVRCLRKATGHSQAALAESAGISRRMLTNIEKGDVNVSLSTLDRLAAALDVAFYALVAPPGNSDAAHIDELAWAGQAPSSQGRLLASKTATQEVELWSWSLAPGESYASEADPDGWLNMVVVTQGQLTVTLGPEQFVVESGDFRVFSTDRPHRYANETTIPLHFIRNVVY